MALESTIPLVSNERQGNVKYFYLAVPSTSYTYSYIKSVPLGLQVVTLTGFVLT